VKPLSEEEIAEGWIEHMTKAAPVFGGSSRIDVKLSNGEIVKDMIADNWNWGESSAYGWAVAWRPHGPKRDQGEALKAAVHEGVDKLGDERLPRFHELGMRYEEQDKAMGDDKPAKDLRGLDRFSHHKTTYVTHVFYDVHRICTITNGITSWSHHLRDMDHALRNQVNAYINEVEG